MLLVPTSVLVLQEDDIESKATDSQSGPPQTCQTESFATIVNGFQPLTIVHKFLFKFFIMDGVLAIPFGLARSYF